MINRLGAAVEGLTGRLGRIEAAVPSILERLDGLAESAATHTDDVEALRESLDAPAAARPAPDTDVAQQAGMQDALGRIEEALDGLHERAADRTAYDELSARLDDIQERLFGAEGLHGRVAALADETDREPVDVEEVVARAVADSERRLTDHVDAAVLALAEVLVRRRGARSSRVDPPQPVVVATAPVAAREEAERGRGRPGG